MLESLVNPKKAERKPWEMLFVGIFYSALAILISNFLFLNNYFAKYISFANLLFTVILSMPFFYYTLKLEEKKDIEIKSEKRLLREHSRAILTLLFLFMGFVITFALVYSFFPPDLRAKNFQLQAEIYCSVNSRNIDGCVSGYLYGNYLFFGSLASTDALIKILTNNFFVMLFCLLFSLVIGAGAIFILVWNAGAIAAAIGIFSTNFAKLPHGFFVYMLHGLPEIAAYFVAALAGGILSVGVIKKHQEREFMKLIKDSIFLFLIGIAILVFAAIIEVFITPLFI